MYPRQFKIKNAIFHNSPKLLLIFGYFCKELCYQELSKISQSGHTGNGLCPMPRDAYWNPLQTFWHPLSCPIIVILLGYITSALTEIKQNSTQFDHCFCSFCTHKTCKPPSPIIFNKCPISLIWTKDKKRHFHFSDRICF